MTQYNSILEAFVKLGRFLGDYVETKQSGRELTSAWSTELDRLVSQAKHHNGWFTEENLLFALHGWSEQLTQDTLEAWLSGYQISDLRPMRVAIIMAGNIPLVGFHDFLAALMTGNAILAKLSSNDAQLLPFLARYLIHQEPLFEQKIQFTDTKLENFDAVIATGSTNTSRYFEHYFGKYPNIIRRNRNSVAVLTGKESQAQLTALGEDIFRYYGLGCRSVSKIFVPEGYDFNRLFEAIYTYRNVIDSAKYANNYDYNKAVYLMSEFKILDNGFLILKEDENYASPIASLFYETYSAIESIKQRLFNDSDKLQCVVSEGVLSSEVAFGATQSPNLSDYADGVDTVEFLLKTSQI